ncbi:MAG: hypothetical protein AABZ76_04130 [Pseudomonadota bacterium]
MSHSHPMDIDSLKVDWKAGRVVEEELRFPAIFEDTAGWVILLPNEMLAASSKAEDDVLIAFGGLIGWIADAAQKAFARNDLVKYDDGFEMQIIADDFSFSVPSRLVN